MSQPLPLLAYTPGEPAGIGFDLAIQLAARESGFPCLVIADPDALAQRARALGRILDISLWQTGEPLSPRSNHLQCLPIRADAPIQPGKLDPANGRYVLRTLERATQGCLNGEFSALVTGPVQKSTINDAGIPFSGHTEWLAEACGGAQPVMVLAAPGLRVALATTHLPLRQVADAITPDLLKDILRIVHAALRDQFGIAHPRITVCGLNPHAGEDGHLGHEEQQLISPTLEALRAEGMNLLGPLPADTAFTPPYMERSDAFLSMFHDQGLPVLKHFGFGRAVNITLGLPIIRTSVDHGTALDLAGTGKAETGSLEYAIEVALQQVIHQARHRAEANEAEGS
ncbi:MAG: 4-hydroxythreonine-4-phosphate dehydrogenase PdxA [Gammaproteobacteria bacterium]